MATAAHPLDALTVDEITAACSVAGTVFKEGAELRFPVVAVAEPPDPAGHRSAEVWAVDRAAGDLRHLRVDLSSGTVVAETAFPGEVPCLLFDECYFAMKAVRSDPRWQAAMAARGIDDVSGVQIDPWPPSWFGLDGEDGRRLTRCVSYIRHDTADNGYAHPVHGLVALVDMTSYEVLDVIDTGAHPVPAGSGRYGTADVGPLREGLKPIEIAQPDGPSFTLEGSHLRWLGWDVRFSVHPIEGLVLHDVGYKGRPILARASIAEMVVPYGSNDTNHWWKNAFDVGDWGLGRMIQSLTLGCDCLGEIRYADAALPDEQGGGRVVANAVCMHEEDYGILWKHVDLWSGTDEVRRSRRLVVSSVSTVGNYEYGFFWYFYLDGNIQLEVKLTGIMQTGAGTPDPPDAGTVIGDDLWAPNHQHLFCARLEMAVDGPANCVAEVDATGASVGPGNEHGNAIRRQVTLLERESDAQRMADPLRSRRWRVLNRGVTNAWGQPTAYDLVPTSPATLLADPDSNVARRAVFATRSLWVTPYDPDERRPAGEHPNQHPGGDGLPRWTAADRSIVDARLVLWHTFGVTHVPRPEDWPVMPVEYAGFLLRPVGFFDRNPALDLPASGGHCHPD